MTRNDGDSEDLRVKNRLPILGDSRQMHEDELSNQQQRERDERLTGRIRRAWLAVAVKSSIQISRIHRLGDRRRAALKQALSLEERHVFVRRAHSSGREQSIGAGEKQK